jgi:hypothetical protein
LPEPKVVDFVEIIPNKGALGKAFKTDAKQITEALAALSINEVICSELVKSYFFLTFTKSCSILLIISNHR